MIPPASWLMPSRTIPERDCSQSGRYAGEEEPDVDSQDREDRGFDGCRSGDAGSEADRAGLPGSGDDQRPEAAGLQGPQERVEL